MVFRVLFGWNQAWVVVLLTDQSWAVGASLLTTAPDWDRYRFLFKFFPLEHGWECIAGKARFQTTCSRGHLLLLSPVSPLCYVLICSDGHGVYLAYFSVSVQ